MKQQIAPVQNSIEELPASPRRRRLLVSGAAAAVGTWMLPGCATQRPPSPGTMAVAARTDVADLTLLNRLTWGIESTSLGAFNAQGSAAWVQSQLHPPVATVLPQAVQARIDALPLLQKPMQQWVVDMEQRRRDEQGLPNEDARKEAQQTFQQDLNRLARDAATRTLLLALYSPDQLREQMTWFWFNHFNVHQNKGLLRAMVGDYENHLRPHALGRFRDLLVASATHPAMIRYLDNEQNANNRINENYAREVMELHTLGQDGGYSQKDVQELARVLTGLGVNFDDKPRNMRPALMALYSKDGATEFLPQRHDTGDKLVLGVKVRPSGMDEIIDQLNRLARHPSTASHISRKLAVYFVSDQPPPAMIDRMSRRFTATDGDIAEVLAAMFESPEFRASLAPTSAGKFKDPMHYVVSAVRLAYDGRPILNCAPMMGWLNRLGEGLYNRQTPDGYPLDETAWSSSGQMSTRFEIARAIGSGSAGLFRVEGAPADQPAFPQLSNALYHGALAATLKDRTRVALDGATSPQEWNMLLLSSPEFMYR